MMHITQGQRLFCQPYVTYNGQSGLPSLQFFTLLVLMMMVISSLWLERYFDQKYSQLSLRRTLLGPAQSDRASQGDVRLIESQIEGHGKERQGPTLGVRFTGVSVLQRCPLRESRLYSKRSKLKANSKKNSVQFQILK